jgi:hypothetical protein
MSDLLARWVALTETFSVGGAAALVLYAVVVAAAVLALVVEIGRSIRQFFRHRAVSRQLEAIRRAAYREHHGGRDAA